MRHQRHQRHVFCRASVDVGPAGMVPKREKGSDNDDLQAALSPCPASPPTGLDHNPLAQANQKLRTSSAQTRQGGFEEEFDSASRASRQKKNKKQGSGLGPKPAYIIIIIINHITTLDILGRCSRILVRCHGGSVIIFRLLWALG